MKTYIFLTNSITNMGGAQMLLRNKMLDLESRGWEVHIFYYFSGDNILIPEFKKFSNNRIPELKYPFYAYSPKERERVIDKISKKLINNGDVIIESDFFHLSFWGELIASKVRGINILYFIGEEFPNISVNEEKFLLYKQNRREFVNHLSIKQKYSQLVASFHNSNDVLGMPSYNNVYSSEEYSIEYDKTYPVITSIGRLEKNYILPMVKGIIEFAEENDQIVNLFFIGGAEFDTYLEEIKSILSKTSKVIPYFFGYMYPIPLTLLKATDVAIAVSGSVRVSASQNIPTISICIEDCQPLGVYGYTTNSRLFRTTEPVVSLPVLLKDIIIDGKYRDSYNYQEEDEIQIYEKNASLIASLLKNERDYYNCEDIYPITKQLAVKLYRFLRTILYKSTILQKSYKSFKKMVKNK